MSDPDAVEAIERRTCPECGRLAPVGRWRCVDCVPRPIDGMLAVLREARLEERRHGEGRHD